MNPWLGVFLHALGGLAAGSFYIPFKKVRGWAWENYWLVSGVFAWLAVPWVVALLTVPGVGEALRTAPASSLLWCYVFGLLWGVGGLTFGLTMRYLGMSLGYALALGNTAAFGTVIPPLYFGQFGALLRTPSGLVTLGGVLASLAGIAVAGAAGMAKERRLTEAEKKASVKEFDFKKGFFIAITSGVMSACFAFGIAAGKPVAARALASGTPALWQNGPVFIVILAGGFTTNLIWCLFLFRKNKSARNYIDRKTPLLGNFLFAALAGATWYFQFMFYGMGTTKMGRYDFSSWSIHMAFIIVFSNIWGLLFREWKGSPRKVYGLIAAGLLILVLSTVIIGAGNFLASKGQ
ncbi:MAG: L-rhamnose/proton symporter RhaT [Candidatus Aminicenantes bacterium]|nr:L-rhamnose/proton symporter RhaT [Candidatus Aminicenantes bacterium]